MSNIVEIHGLNKSYEDVHAVKDLTFNIKEGEIFGFLGPNGAGKTTTIKCITQLATMDEGSIKVSGYDVKDDYLEAREKIGLSQQEVKLDPYFSVIDTLEYAGGYFGIPKAEARRRCKRYLKKFDLFDKKDDDTRKLSGGMKRKLSIIKALLHKPDILILDEPTAGLDVDSRYELWNFIKEQNKKGTTIILTTHYIEEAEKLADRIGIINHGELIKLEEKSKIIDELSQNVIALHLEKDVDIPEELKEVGAEKEGRIVNIQTKKKDQHDTLRKALTILENNDIDLDNFEIEQDNLENIFRRIVQ